jgi:ATP-dependent Clp protease ATP-binding subunit ClpA
MTSNLGANEMSQLTTSKLGFSSALPPTDLTARNNQKLGEKVARTGLEAARRKFTPEFINRLDKIVVFKPLGETELRKIVDLELNQVQQRIFNSSDRPFVFTASDGAKEHLLKEGTDVKYGARHLKRAIERLLVQPMSNLIATDQVRGGDWIKIDIVDGRISFNREAEELPVHAMAELVDNSIALPLASLAQAISAEPAKIQTARTSRRS